MGTRILQLERREHGRAGTPPGSNRRRSAPRMTRPRWPRSVSALIAMAPPLGAALARRARVRRRKASSWRLEAGSHLLRGLGLVYLIAFTSLRAQILGL